MFRLNEQVLKQPVGDKDKCLILEFFNFIFETNECPGKNHAGCKLPGTRMKLVFHNCKYENDDKINGKLLNASLIQQCTKDSYKRAYTLFP